jgi:hypothetical protein
MTYLESRGFTKECRRDGRTTRGRGMTSLMSVAFGSLRKSGELERDANPNWPAVGLIYANEQAVLGCSSATHLARQGYPIDEFHSSTPGAEDDLRLTLRFATGRRPSGSPLSGCPGHYRQWRVLGESLFCWGVGLGGESINSRPDRSATALARIPK